MANPRVIMMTVRIMTEVMVIVGCPGVSHAHPPASARHLARRMHNWLTAREQKLAAEAPASPENPTKMNDTGNVFPGNMLVNILRNHGKLMYPYVPHVPTNQQVTYSEIGKHGPSARKVHWENLIYAYLYNSSAESQLPKQICGVPFQTLTNIFLKEDINPPKRSQMQFTHQL